MKKLIIAVAALAVAAPVAGAQAQTLNADVVRAAKCSGAIAGNALIDYFNDEDEDRFLNRVYPANYVLLDTLREEGLTNPDDVAVYDNLMAQTAGQFVSAAEEDIWSIEEWEYLIGCYDDILATMPVDPDRRVEAGARAATSTYLENVKILLE
ncbi:hypothetical protein C882_2794 [Caenispirillum salinarum AK4]|uniref:Uncharacterized protein n=1 Tax=Caenispirillum salinarum AK4 TaxID=1238182 RepID=K9GNR3_9PROT|nr:hypothetical protein [Caenispirillum salinarum]EKV26359.1 hypothetical protein C882_2794 [Caenispirillum salinarum AK4]